MFIKFRRTTDMESSHGQLRTRFTNGLSRNDTNSFTNINQMPMSQISSIALGTNAMFGTTS